MAARVATCQYKKVRALRGLSSAGRPPVPPVSPRRSRQHARSLEVTRQTSPSDSGNRSRSGTLKATDAATSVATVGFEVPPSRRGMDLGWIPINSAACS
jgi:hypothetical protein